MAAGSLEVSRFVTNKIEKFLKTDIYGEEKYFFKLQRFGFGFIGFWFLNFTNWQIGFTMFNSLEILFYAIFQINFCVKNFNNLVEFLSGITPLVTQVITAFKILIVLSRREAFKSILTSLHESFVNGKWEIYDIPHSWEFFYIILQMWMKNRAQLTLVPAKSPT